jgi:alpha-1,3-glucosyltransferase
LGPFGHSGYGIKPLHGDFEAQRHWMEITVNTPPHLWYVQTHDNDLLYWGLDYPPVSAFWAYLTGFVARSIYPPMVSLFLSRGIEDTHTIMFMRLSVIVADLVFLTPAILALLNQLAAVYSSVSSRSTQRDRNSTTTSPPTLLCTSATPYLSLFAAFAAHLASPY